MCSDSSSNQWKVECSDDENYSNYSDNYRIVNGKRIWEPSGDTICSLYTQLEKKGFIDLKWQCPGRRSPSVHSSQHNTNGDKQVNSVDKTDANCIDIKPNLNEFDFEADLDADTSLPAKVNNPRRRSTQGVKKSNANLNKVMQDIKKYQLIDQQNK